MNLSKEQLKMHRKEIQAWADGKQIQYRIDDDCEWKDENDPAFFTDCEYRVKPNPVLIPYEDFLKTFTFFDGTPCGKPDL